MGGRCDVIIRAALSEGNDRFYKIVSRFYFSSVSLRFVSRRNKLQFPIFFFFFLTKGEKRRVLFDKKCKRRKEFLRRETKERERERERERKSLAKKRIGDTEKEGSRESER